MGWIKVWSLSLLLLLAGNRATAMGMANTWQETVLGPKDCLRQAEIAMRNTEFSENFEIVGGYTVYGDRGAYTASIACITQKEVVTFVVAGPDDGLVAKYRDALLKNFKSER